MRWGKSLQNSSDIYWSTDRSQMWIFEDAVYTHLFLLGLDSQGAKKTSDWNSWRMVGLQRFQGDLQTWSRCWWSKVETLQPCKHPFGHSRNKKPSSVLVRQWFRWPSSRWFQAMDLKKPNEWWHPKGSRVWCSLTVTTQGRMHSWCMKTRKRKQAKTVRTLRKNGAAKMFKKQARPSGCRDNWLVWWTAIVTELQDGDSEVHDFCLSFSLIYSQKLSSIWSFCKCNRNHGTFRTKNVRVSWEDQIVIVFLQSMVVLFPILVW